MKTPCHPRLAATAIAAWLVTTAMAVPAAAQVAPPAATTTWAFDETTTGGDIGWTSPTSIDPAAVEVNGTFTFTLVEVGVSWIGIPLGTFDVTDQVPPDQLSFSDAYLGPAPIVLNDADLVAPDPPEPPALAGHLTVLVDAAGFGSISFTNVVLGTAEVDLGAPFGVQTVQITSIRVVGTLEVAATWFDLGFALAGTSGDPLLVGTGALAGGDPISLTLSNARPSAPAFLFVGFSRIDYPFFYGGTLVPDPNPPWLLLILFTDASGNVPLSATWPAGLPSRFDTYFQSWIDDPAAPYGYAGSNALQGVTP